jgi:flavin-dependent dehydrogenase
MRAGYPAADVNKPEPVATAIPPRHCDVLIIGGGPGGSTAAIELARKGYQVAMLEKERHPRFHIGESLLPANLPLFERLGVADEMRAIGMPKWGAEFLSPWHAQRSQTFEFAEAWDKSMPFAYQVRRSTFDDILFRRAAVCGAQTFEGCRVRDVQWLPEGAGALVQAEHDDGRRESWQARFVVDASGRDTFLSTRMNWKHRDPKHNSSAMYAHFKGALRHDDKRAGHISLFWFEHGWFWFIPLADGVTSIGAVVWPYYMKGRDKPLREFFLDTLAQCPMLQERLREAEMVSPVEATGNYSYGSDHAHGENFLLIGDAFAFIDPVFSSGVMLAMTSAIAGAKAIDICLREPRRAKAALRDFERFSRRGPKLFSWFIHRITHPTMRDIFMGPRNLLRMKEALLSLLAGDIYGKTPIWASLRAFKIMFYLASLGRLKRSLMAVRRRRHNIRVVEPDSMTVD